MQASTTVLLIACVLGGLGAAGSVGGAPEYGLSVAGSVDAPDRTLPVAGHRFTVSEVASVEPGGALAVDVAAPDAGPYDLLLYDADRRIVHGASASAGQRVTVGTEGLEPGAYLLALRDEEAIRAVHPVVVDGYDVAVDAPDAAQAGASPTVVVSVRPERSTGAPARVTVVASNGEETVSAVADRRADGRYVARLDLGGVPPGAYTVFASVHGEKSVYGRAEPLGLSEERLLNVTHGTVDAHETADATRTSTSTPAQDGTPTATRQVDASSPSTPSVTVTSGRTAESPSFRGGELLPFGIGGVLLFAYAYLRRP